MHLVVEVVALPPKAGVRRALQTETANSDTAFDQGGVPAVVLVVVAAADPSSPSPSLLLLTLSLKMTSPGVTPGACSLSRSNRISASLGMPFSM